MYASHLMKSLNGIVSGNFEVVVAGDGQFASMQADVGDIGLLTTNSTTTTGETVTNSMVVSTDVSVGSTGANSSNEVVIQNTSTGDEAMVALRMTTTPGPLDPKTTGLFKNGPNKSSDGGADTMTLRNDGTLRLLTTGDTGITVGGIVTTDLPLRVNNDYMVLGSTPIDSYRHIVVNNQSTSSNAYVAFTLNTDGPDGILFKNGPGRSADGGANTMTLRNDGGDLRLQRVGAQGITISSGAITLDLPMTIATINTSNINVSGTVAADTSSATTMNTTTLNVSGQILSSNTTNASVSLNGALWTLGGIKVSKTLVANQGVQIPYAQAFKSDDNHAIQTKMMDAQFNLAGGVLNDGLYLYTPGSTPGYASSGYVLGINASEAKFPQNVTIAGNISVGGTITGGSISYSSTSSGTFDVTNTTGTTLTVASTSANSMVLQGGATINGNLVVGGTLTAGSIAYSSTATGTLQITNTTGTTLQVLSTDQSSNASTGAAVVSGGLGVAKNIHCDGNFHGGATNPTNGSRNINLVNSSTNVSARSEVILTNSAGRGTLGMLSTGASDANAMILQNEIGTVRMYGPSSTGISVGSSQAIHDLNTTFASTTDSTSPTTGAIIVQGGVAIQKNLNVSGQTIFGLNNPIDAQRYISVSNSSTGSNAQVYYILSTDGVSNGLIYKNGPNYTGGDGLANTMTIRNQNGNVRMFNNTGAGYILSGSDVNISGNLNYRTTNSPSTAYTDPGVTIQSGAFGGSGNTPLFLKSTLGDGQEATLMLGNSISTNQCLQLAFKNATLDSNKQVKLGFYGQDALTLQNGKMSVFGSPFFGYSEGTWTPNLQFAEGGGVFNDVNDSSYIKIGRTVTLSCYVKFSYGNGRSGQLSIRNVPFWPTRGNNEQPLPSTMMPLNSTELGGLSKPYQAGFEFIGGECRIYFSNGQTYYAAQLLGAASQVISFQITYITDS